MNIAPTVVVFTGSFPYDVEAEGTFLQHELRHLTRAFGRTIVVPGRLDGGRDSVPPGVEVDESYARGKANGLARSLGSRGVSFTKEVVKELWSNPQLPISPRGIRRLLIYLANAFYARRWLRRFVFSQGIEAEHSVFYTYWLGAPTLGTAWAKKDHPGLVVVSRAHGGDLYIERHRPRYLPCRKQTLEGLDKLYLISSNGLDYVKRRYGQYIRSCEVARIGVADPGFVTARSQDGVFRLVSCAALVPVKRMDLLARGLGCAGRARPHAKFEWHHFGDGSERGVVQQAIREHLPDTVAATLMGNLPNAEVMKFYQTRPIDAFVNVSISEGVPVAVMEAQSCEIPVVATNVGGNPEIVTPENGILLSPNPTVEEVGGAILDLQVDSDRIAQKKLASRRTWAELCDAEINFSRFAKNLAAMAKGARA